MNDTLFILVFGESLLNDAVVVVLYNMLQEFSLIGESNLYSEHYINATLNFFCVTFGGIAIGFVFAIAAVITSKYTNHVRLLEPFFVLAIAYTSYLVSELFSFSGIFALTIAGIILSQYIQTNFSKRSHSILKNELRTLATLAEAIVFLFLGLSMYSTLKEFDHTFFLITLVSCFVYRFAGTYLLTFFANQYRVEKIDLAQQFVLSYGGIRGAIAFCLAASVDDNILTPEQKRTFQATTLFVVFFTVFVQGSTIGPLVHWLKVKTKSGDRQIMMEIVTQRSLDHIMSGIETVSDVRGSNWTRRIYEKFNNRFVKPYLLRMTPEGAEADLVDNFQKYEVNQLLTNVLKAGIDYQGVKRTGRSSKLADEGMRLSDINQRLTSTLYSTLDLYPSTRFGNSEIQISTNFD